MEQIRDERLPSDNAKRDDDVMTEATSRTEDDPVGDAFRTALDQDSDGDGVDGIDDDEEQIVWDPRWDSIPFYCSLSINGQKIVPHFRRISLSSHPAESNDSRESSYQPYWTSHDAYA